MGYRNVRLHVLDEIVLPESNIGEACNEFVRARLLAGHRAIEVRIYGNLAGSARSHVRASDWEIVRQCLARETDIRYSMHVPSSHPAVKDRVNAVNAMLCSTMGERRLLLDPGCNELRKDLQQVVWKNRCRRQPHRRHRQVL